MFSSVLILVGFVRISHVTALVLTSLRLELEDAVIFMAVCLIFNAFHPVVGCEKSRGQCVSPGVGIDSQFTPNSVV